MKKQSDDSQLSFEKAMQTLENIVQELERGDLSLEESLKIYEHGVKLAAQCQTTLTQAEQKVAILSNLGNEKEVLEPYFEVASKQQDDEWA